MRRLAQNWMSWYRKVLRGWGTMESITGMYQLYFVHSTFKQLWIQHSMLIIASQISIHIDTLERNSLNLLPIRNSICIIGMFDVYNRRLRNPPQSKHKYRGAFYTKRLFCFRFKTPFCNALKKLNKFDGEYNVFFDTVKLLLSLSTFFSF